MSFVYGGRIIRVLIVAAISIAFGVNPVYGIGMKMHSVAGGIDSGCHKMEGHSNNSTSPSLYTEAPGLSSRRPYSTEHDEKCELNGCPCGNQNRCCGGFFNNIYTFLFFDGTKPPLPWKELKDMWIGAELEPHLILPYKPPESFPSP